jgi:hypothetical protein
MTKRNLINLITLILAVVIGHVSEAQSFPLPGGDKCSAEVSKEESLLPIFQDAVLAVGELATTLSNLASKMEVDEEAIKKAVQEFSKKHNKGWTPEYVDRAVGEIVAEAVTRLVTASKEALAKSIQELATQVQTHLVTYDPHLKFVAMYNHKKNKRVTNEWLGESANRSRKFLFEIESVFGVGFGSGASVGIEASIDFKLEKKWGIKIEHERTSQYFSKDETWEFVTVVAKPQYTVITTGGGGVEAFIKANTTYKLGDAKDLPFMQHTFALPKPCLKSCP